MASYHATVSVYRHHSGDGRFIPDGWQSMQMQDTVALAILAGGQGRRLGGGDKALLPIAGRPLLAHLLDRLRPQAARIVLSANGDPARFAAFSLPVVADAVADAGPLAGIAATAAYCVATWPDTRRLVTIPVDTPCPPADLVARLTAAPEELVAVAAAGGRLHWGTACWQLSAALRLDAAVRGTGLRRLEEAARAEGIAPVPFADADAFTNINTPENLKSAIRLLIRP